MTNINTATVAGRLTADPDLRTSAGGASYSRVRMALDRRVKRKEKWTKEPVYLNVMLFGARAEAFAKYHKKGSACCFVNAELAFNEWEKDGVKRSEVYLVANEWQFVGGKKDGGQQSASLDDEDAPF